MLVAEVARGRPAHLSPSARGGRLSFRGHGGPNGLRSIAQLLGGRPACCPRPAWHDVGCLRHGARPRVQLNSRRALKSFACCKAGFVSQARTEEMASCLLNWPSLRPPEAANHESCERRSRPSRGSFRAQRKPPSGCVGCTSGPREFSVECWKHYRGLGQRGETVRLRFQFSTRVTPL
jgi:hypothetical protein